MTEKRFKLDDFDSEVEMLELINTQSETISDLKKENEQLKQRINSRLHFYRELYESTNDKVVERVIEDLEDILKR